MPRFCFGINPIAIVKPFAGFAGCLAIGPAKPREDFTDYSVATHNMFEGEIKWISPFIKSRKEGFFRVITFDVFDTEKETGKVYLDPKNRNYAQWEPLLREGVVLKNLMWKDRKKGTIDGDSPVAEV